METFISCGWNLFTFAIILVGFKIILPKESYEYRTSLIVAFIAILWFTKKLLGLIEDEEYMSSIWPILCVVAWAMYITSGGRTIPFKTQAAVFSSVTDKSVGTMTTGGLNWTDPLFEYIKASIDLREILCELPSTSDLQTKTRGIKAKIKEISFILKVKDGADVSVLFNIAGGAETIKRRIRSFMEEFFIGKVGALLPEDLDTDKHHTIEDLSAELKTEVNLFCDRVGYPYEIPDGSDVLIGDTELEQAYYDALAKIAFTVLEEEAKTISAVAIKNRLLDLGRELLPGGSEADQLKAAQVSLGIIKKDLQEKRFSIDADTGMLLKAIAEILKK